MNQRDILQVGVQREGDTVFLAFADATLAVSAQGSSIQQGEQMRIPLTPAIARRLADDLLVAAKVADPAGHERMIVEMSKIFTEALLTVDEPKRQDTKH